jgi:hypothetical protein
MTSNFYKAVIATGWCLDLGAFLELGSWSLEVFP